MGDTKYIILKVIFYGSVAIGGIAAIVGFFMMISTLPGFSCFDFNVLKPGYQSACYITKDEFPSGTFDVEIDNETFAGARIETYVFTKIPNRTFVEELIDWKLEDDSGRYRYFDLPAIADAIYTIHIEADEKIDVKYVYKGHRRYHTIYYVENVKFFTGEFKASVFALDAYFYVKCPKSTKGKFQVTAHWPRFVWGPRDYVMSCVSYPCTFDLSDPKLVDQNLTFVTVNNGKDTYEIDTTAYKNKAVWIPTTVVLFVGGIIIAVGACALYFIFGD